ncbi:Sec-independent protein translocase subunit TatA/TatB [Polaribacter sp.]|jgi:sec-independent protein translocase protein TatA|uniref:Sec-independent protein translocase subunit TatA/TatB n=1 Tax=Polaribacter sp. TaxID=1920175 RepID=UPI0040482474
MNTPFLFISGQEIFFIMIIIVMFFGADKIPEIARGLGKGMRQIKDATNDIKNEINESAKNNKINIDVPKSINENVSEVKDTIEEITGPIKRNM